MAPKRDNYLVFSDIEQTGPGFQPYNRLYPVLDEAAGAPPAKIRVQATNSGVNYYPSRYH